MCGCGTASHSSSVAQQQTAAPPAVNGTPTATAPSYTTLAGPCSTAPCFQLGGRFVLGTETVLPGLKITVPPNWTSSENDQGEFTVSPPGGPDGENIAIWRSMQAVKSTGKGHGTTYVQVGTTPAALAHWMMHNPDSPPAILLWSAA